LDGRTFRDSRRESHKMFGQDQEKWLAEVVDREVSWLLTGSQFFGGYLKKDSYESNFPQDFKRFIGFLRELPTQFILGSGDVHFSEVMSIEEEQLGYPTLEITASSLHSFSVPGLPWFYEIIRGENPRRIAATGSHNFTLVEVKNNHPDRYSLLVEGINWLGWRRFSVPFEVELMGGTKDCENLLLKK